MEPAATPQRAAGIASCLMRNNENMPSTCLRVRSDRPEERYQELRVNRSNRECLLLLPLTASHCNPRWGVDRAPVDVMDGLPAELVASVLQFLPLQELITALVALGTACRACSEHLSEHSVVWGILLPLIATAPAQSAPLRKSARLASASPKETWVRAWRSVLTRAEAVHHQVACAGQDSKDLGVARLRRLIARHGPWPLVDRASPIYNATVLMETCRARGIREADHVALADYMINCLGADPSARPSASAACTPLIIAACRGLPRLAAFLLACGADPHPRGRGG